MTYLIYIFTILFLTGLDQFSKSLVVSYIDEFAQIPIINGFFSLIYVRNTGAGFSIMEGQQTILILITIVAIIYFSYSLYKAKNRETLKIISLILIISGAIGNLIDRISYNYVIDFLDFVIFSYDFPVFNIADCLLCVGVGLLLIDVLMEGKHAKH